MKKNRGYAIYLIPGVLASLAVIVVPLVMTVYVSFTKWTGVGTPRWVGFDNYTRLFQDTLFWQSFSNIGLLVLAMAVVPTLLGLFLAAVLFDYVAKKFGDRWAGTLRSGYYIPQVLPVAVTGIVWGWILHPDYGALNKIMESIGLGGLTRNWLGDPDYALYSVMAVMIWFQLGYPVVMFMAGLSRVDPELYEAADLDGASWWQRFRKITVYMIRPEFYVVLVTTTIAALKIFGQVFVLTGGGPSNATLVPSYFAYKNFFEKAQVGYGSAISTVLTVLIVLLAFLFLRLQHRAEETR
ncbi:raffinose/stachyose/melibiose transport system permease protein [Actinoplanes lutulentus]|uniref:Carbohydrate ABC transporter membrane protein 1 (CUT1 family) n=1 Tax=Actinoplanes lutulentus TaxID=1287878 RepID=A0A327Z0W7_9ACTN|nr:sugar ABC transporter permease [Actinoplanes lutulentus]MBB2948689.1 raffinose/stachyose/melibiose transport system permease protein [Actinoplanes lutulentus]RAK27940.1 carbohydrate ABC transporter membrane protein 1 (CUT1 family) [Actinoplanes lutulentus]